MTGETVGAAPGGYVFATTDAGADGELRRLRLLERRYDDVTFRRLREFGDLRGARCVEAGAGAGSVARWLGRQVGPRGRVLAIDIDPRFLAGSQGPNVHVRRHDIVTQPLEPASADLAHCRALLRHLAEPEVALVNMVAALRPGGRILLEDADCVTVMAADPRHPAAAAFDRVTAAMFASAYPGHLDPWFGRRLFALARACGLADCRQEATAALRWGGSPKVSSCCARPAPYFRPYGRGEPSTWSISTTGPAPWRILHSASTTSSASRSGAARPAGEWQAR